MSQLSLFRPGTRLELSTFALWWLEENALCTIDVICYSVKHFSRLWDSMLRPREWGHLFLLNCFEMFCARAWGDGAPCPLVWPTYLYVMPFWILQRIVLLVGVDDAIRNTQWYEMHMLLRIVESLTRMLQVSLLRLWIWCLSSGLWSPILSCWPCTLVIVRKCIL